MPVALIIRVYFNLLHVHAREHITTRRAADGAGVRNVSIMTPSRYVRIYTTA